MKLTTKRNGTELTIFLDGEVNILTAKDLDERIQKELPDTKNLILDFEKCDYLSSAGFRVLLAAYKELKKVGGSLSIVNPGEYIVEALEASGLDGIFDNLASDRMKKEELHLAAEWDKTFPKSETVDHSKVTFVNRYGITLAADLYVPKNAAGKLPAIAVSGPFGAVKEQCSGLYAQTMAERGFLTIAFDPSFTGESGGNVRYMASPDINTEDFMAAVDFLSLHEKVDPERIGIIGICGWGGLAINAAALDTRIKATAASTMYDMTRVNANGYFDSEDSEEARYEKKKAMCAQRLADLRSGEYKLGGGVVDPLPEDAPFFVKDYHAYYKTDRGYHARSLNSNGGWNVIGCESFMNQPILKYSNEIRSAVLLIHGEKAHSCYFSKDAYAAMIEGSRYADNKELMIIPDAVHTDLYDGGGKNAIPFDKLERFFTEYLK